MGLDKLSFGERKELAMAIAKSVSTKALARREAYINIGRALRIGNNSVELGVGGGYTDDKVVAELYYGCESW